MGLYIRKSVRVGPLRFNLSKSGIGVSAGMPGFRIGTGPRGNYIHMGANGLYYRSTLPLPDRKPASLPAHLLEHNHLKEPASHSALEKVKASDVSQMVDSSSALLLAEIDRKSKRISLWPFVAGFGLFIFSLLIFNQVSFWVCIPFAMISVAGTLAVYLYDLQESAVVILYDFDSEMQNAYEQVHGCLTQLANCSGKWHIDARGQVYDPKYHGGAGQIVSRKKISINNVLPSHIKTNIQPLHISLGARRFYFFPERILVFSDKGVGAVSYSDLSIVINNKHFIEDEAVPRDAKVIDRTWQYVNKKGGPDLRFKNNPEMPICQYEELWLNSPTGLNEVIQLSRTGFGKPLDDSIQYLADVVSLAASKPIPAIPEWNSEPNQAIPEPVAPQPLPVMKKEQQKALHEVLFEILCCVMAADGLASAKEKKCIIELMGKVKSPWTKSEIEAQIESFISRIKAEGYRRILSSTLAEVSLFRQANKHEILLHCLKILAEVDGELGPREHQLCQRIRILVEPHEAAEVN